MEYDDEAAGTHAERAARPERSGQCRFTGRVT
jgi:hypothetical protein